MVYFRQYVKSCVRKDYLAGADLAGASPATTFSMNSAGDIRYVVAGLAPARQALAPARLYAHRRGVRTISCLVSHSWANPAPAISALVTDELVIFPWDQQVLIEGHWQPHPEIVKALNAQLGRD